jgi:hypothetical protein
LHALVFFLLLVVLLKFLKILKTVLNLEKIH